MMTWLFLDCSMDLGHPGDGDEHEKYTEDESPVFDGGPFETFGVGFGEGGTLRRVLSYAHDVVVPFSGLHH